MHIGVSTFIVPVGVALLYCGWVWSHQVAMPIPPVLHGMDTSCAM